MASKIRASANDYEKKKLAIAAVIDFNSAIGVDCNRVKLFKHFGVSVTTGYAWFPVPEGAEGGKPRGRPRLNKSGVKNDNSSTANAKKRSLSALRDVKSERQDDGDIQVVIKADPGEPRPSVTPSKNPTAQAGRGRKKLKTTANDPSEQISFSTPPPSTAPISPPPTVNARSSHSEQLSTPPSRKRGRPRKAVVEARQAESRREMADSDSDFEDDEFFAV